MKKIFLLFISTFFFLGYLLAQHNAKFFDYTINNSDLIIEGEIIQQTSYWNSSHTMLYTDNTLKIYNLFKGNVRTESIIFTTEGGQVDNYKIQALGLLQPKINDKGIYYLNNSNNKIRPLQGEKSYVKYINNKATLNGKSYEISEIQKLIISKTGNLPQVKTSFIDDSKINQLLKIGGNITSFNPSTIAAGTGGILTIQGNGFGSFRGTGKVLFTSASFFEPISVDPYPAQYIFWSDTLILVEVPSRGYSDNSLTAGSGFISVESDTSFGNTIVSTNSLHIEYSRLNLDDGGLLVEPKFKDKNGIGGYHFNLSNNIDTNIAANEAFQRSLQTWRCATDVNWEIGPSSNDTINSLDGLSLVKFRDMGPFIISVTYQYFINCGGDWYIEEVDIDVSNVMNWHYGSNSPGSNQWDFESSMVFALGSAHMVKKSNEPYNVMYHSHSKGDTYKVLGTGDINCGTYVMGQSIAASGCALGSMTLIGSCQVGYMDDAAVEMIVMPMNNSCNGNIPVKVKIRNPGLTNLTSTQIIWSINGTPQSAYNWTGNIPTGDTSTVTTIGTFNFSNGATSIMVATNLPNGNTDGQSANDTLIKNVAILTCNAMNISAFGYSSPTNYGNCLGNLPITLEVYNNTSGQNLYNCVIQWEIDGIPQNPYYLNDTVAPYNYTYPTLGYYNFTVPGTQIKAWIEYPNGLPDINNAGDTTYLNFTPIGLSGTYTVGGSSPDFTDINAAFSAVNGNGLCGPVTMNIRPGTYTGPSLLDITNQKKPTAVNPLIFQSELGDSSAVIITSSASNSSGSNYTVKIDNVGYVTFHQVTFQTISTSNYRRIVELQNPADYTTFSNCAFIGNNGTSNTLQEALITQNEANPTKLTVENCSFTNVPDGIGIADCRSVLVENNRFDNVSDYFFLAYMIDSLTLNGNYKTAGTYGKFIIQYCTKGLVVSNNQFYNSNGTFNYNNSSSTDRGLILNNMFVCDLAETNRGLQISNTHNFDFIHNTCVSEGSNISGGAPFFLDVGSSSILSGIRLVNNIFANYGPTGYAIREDNNSSSSASQFSNILAESNGNCYYSSSSMLAWLNDPIPTLNGIQAYGGMDANSIEVDPQLLDLSDLHFQPLSINNQLIGAGIPTAYSTDIDGDIRNSFPTIGADEAIFLSFDLGLSHYLMDSVVCNGNNPVQATITNYGGTTVIDSAIFNWKVNGVTQTPYNWSGNLSSSQSTTILLGNYNFTGGSYTIKSWITDVNSTIDPNQFNDTIIQTFDAGGLSGVYTIGGTSPSYINFAAAINALNSQGICSPVIFNARPGIYNENLLLNHIKGADSLNTVTFKSELGNTATINGVFNPGTVVLDGAHDIIFDSITISGNAISIKLQNDPCRNISILNSYIGNAISAQATVLKLHVINCMVMDLINIQPTWHADASSNIHIEGNTISQDVTLYKVDGINLKNNDINDIVYIGYAYDVKVIGNKITHLSTGALGSALRLDVLNSNSKKGLIENNFIYTSYPGASPIYYNPMDDAPDYTDIFNNSLYVDNSSSGAYALTVFGNNNPNCLRFYNNNIQMENAIPFISLAHNISNVEFNNNNYYRSPSLIADFASTWNINGQNISQPMPSLLNWQISLGFDYNSFQVDPGFVSGSSDLHIGTVYQLDGTGNGISNLSIDIDGDIRNPNNPDIGADEIVLPPIGYDIGVLAFDSIIESCDSIPIFVNVKNYGDSTITNFIIDWSISQISQDSVIWNGILKADSISDPILIGYHDFNPASLDSLMAWTYLPNGQIDTVLINDSIETLPLGGKFSGTYTIGATASDFSTFNEAFDLLKLYGLCGPVILEVKDGVYPERLQIGDILGSSSINTITITSQNQNKELVLLGDTVSFPGTANYMLNLASGCQHITFDKVSLANHSNSIVQIDSATHNIYFNDCKFTGGSNSPGAVRAIFDAPLDTLVFNRCDFVHVGNIIYLDIQYNTTNILIDSCNILDPRGGLYVAYANDITIQNSFFEASPTGTIQVDFTIANNVNLIGNHFEDAQVHLASTDCPANSPCLITNNFFSSSTFASLELSYSDNYKVFNNNIYGDYGVFYLRYCSGIELVNNNIHGNDTTTYSYLVQQTIFVADPIDSYNNNIFPEKIKHFYTPSNWNDYTSINSFFLATGMDSNSIGIDPFYVSSKDLHILNPALDGTGMVLPEVNDDIDKEIRDPSSPDIGADEVDFLGLDVLAYSLESPVIICEGSNQIDIKIKNQGTDTLISVDIILQINDSVFAPFSWTGTLPTGQVSGNINIGTINFPWDSSYVFKVWTDSPNGSLDELVTNDSLILTQTYYPALTGTYTIGGVTPHYTTLNDAANALLNNGICGPVIFNIRDGVYTEQITLTDVTGSSAISTITFQSESLDSSLVTIQYNGGSANNHVINITADYVTFRYLKFKPLNTLYGIIFSYEGADNLTIEYCNLTGLIVPIAQSSSWQTLVFHQWNTAHELKLLNNTFVNGSWAFFGGNASVNYDISNNQFINQQRGSIVLGQASDFLIASNTFESFIVSYDNMQAIESGGNNGIIEKNRINNYNGLGINGYNQTYTIVRNNFVSIKKVNSALYVSQAIEVGKHNTIVNNTFVLHQGSANYSYTMSIDDFGNEVKNNIIINLDGGLALEFDYPIASNVFDNNCYYTNGPDLVDHSGTIHNTLAQWQASSLLDGNSIVSNPSFISSSDLHILAAPLLDNAGVPHPDVTEDIDGQVRGALPDIGADEFIPLAEETEAVSLNTLITNCDSSGVEMTIKNNGTNVLTSATINWTVNGVPQLAYLWSGSLAYQSTSTPFVFGGYNFQSGNQYQIIAWVENPNGLPDVYNANDTVMQNVDLNISVDLGVNDTICIGDSILLDAGGPYFSYLWSTASIDSSISVSIMGTYWVTVSNNYSCMASDTIQIDTFPTPPTPTISVNGNNLLSSIPNNIQWYYQGSPISGATFQIYTATNNGWYTVEYTDSNGCTVMSDSVNVTIVGINELENNQFFFDIYPNPTDGKFNIQFINNSSTLLVEIHNLLGQVVYSKNYKKSGIIRDEINLAHLKNGVYSITINTDKIRSIKQFVINK